jgi:hypothetical protein
MRFALCLTGTKTSVTIPGIVGHDRGIPKSPLFRASVTISGMTGHDPPEYPITHKYVLHSFNCKEMLWMPPTLKEHILRTEIKQPLIKKEIPRYGGGSSDGYGIKVPKA